MHTGVEPLAQVTYGGGASDDPKDPFVALTVYVFRDGYSVYAIEPCGTPVIRRQPFSVSEMGTIQEIVIQSCDNLTPDDPKEKCAGAPYLAVQCSGLKELRRLTLTCAGARAKAFVDQLLWRASPGGIGKKASHACPEAAKHRVIAPIDQLAFVGNGAARPAR